jgi:predicted glutamine amidotransferase
MCELMGMCFAKRISADFSIREFAGRGEDNADGWGLAWYPDQSVKVIKEPVRWKASQFSGFLEQYNDLSSSLYIAHVRHKTTGGNPTHADTHPFERELGGRAYSFAHNGTLEGAFWELPLARFHPLGKTDSEYLFCYLVDELARNEGNLDDEISWRNLFRTLTELNRFGRLNCLLSDGRRLFCYHDANGWKGLTFRSTQIWENQPRHFEDATIKIDLAGPSVNVGVVVATAPLSSSGWQSFHPGELLVLEGGRIRFSSHRAVE